MKINIENYVCSICGKRNVKLWRPYMSVSLLICAECAENKQASWEYEEKKWEKKENGSYVGIRTGKKIKLPVWTVNEKGKIPSYDGPGPEGCAPIMTDQLIVNLKDISEWYSSGRTTLVPACPDGDGNFWGYTSVPEEICKWWEELPTRQVKVRLTLKIETEDGRKFKEVIEGAGKIEFLLGEAGILSDEILELLK